MTSQLGSVSQTMYHPYILFAMKARPKTGHLTKSNLLTACFLPHSYAHCQKQLNRPLQQHTNAVVE